MSTLLNYFQRANGLPNPNGPLSTTVSRRAIEEANIQVQKELNKEKKKRGPYKRYMYAYKQNVLPYTISVDMAQTLELILVNMLMRMA